jgi:hypothetical protein
MAKKTLAKKQQKRGGKRARKTQKRMRGGMNPVIWALAVAALLGSVKGFQYNTNINGKTYTLGNDNLNVALETLADDDVIKYKKRSILSNADVTITDCHKAYEIIGNALESDNFESIPKSVQNAIIKVHETFSCGTDGGLKNDERVIVAALKQADLGILEKVPNADVRIAEMEKAIVALENAKPSAEEIDKKTEKNENITKINYEITELQKKIDSLRYIYKIPINIKYQ